MATTELDDSVQAWALATLGASRLVSVTGLRDGGSPWLLVYETSQGVDRAVLRVGAAGANTAHEREVRGIGVAAAGGVPVANVIATGNDVRATMLVIEYVDGTSVQPIEPDPTRLTTLGAIAARIGAVEADCVELPAVAHPIPGVDFDELRAQRDPQPLLVAAQERVAQSVPDDPIGFVHGDLWSGNTLWRGRELAAVIDWDCAGIGAAGVDLGSLRCDAAMCYGLEAPDLVLDGWEQAARQPARSVAYWDAVAALSTPPEIDWFTDAIAGMTGRPDLTARVLRERRDAFLADALDRMP